MTSMGNKKQFMVLLEDKTQGPITWDLCDIPSGTCAWDRTIIMLDYFNWHFLGQ